MKWFTAFRGATRYEIQLGKLWLTIPYWRFWKVGCRPEYGVDRDEI